MSWGAIAGAAVSVIGGAVVSNNGKKGAPAVPYNAVDPTQAQSDAIAGNLANQDSIEQLLTRANRYQQGQAIDLLEQAIPGYTKLSQSLLGRAQDMADNPYDVPKDVQDNLTRIASERGIARGTRGQTNDFSLLRDLGVNSLQFGQDQFKNAMGALTTISGLAPRINPASPLSFFLTPAQSLAAQTGNAQTQQAISQGAANSATAAQNANNQTLWDGIFRGAGMLASGIDWTGNTSGAGSAAGMRNAGAPDSLAVRSGT